MAASPPPPPPLPARPPASDGSGSASTTYAVVPPVSSDPSNPPFREPELVVDDDTDVRPFDYTSAAEPKIYDVQATYPDWGPITENANWGANLNLKADGTTGWGNAVETGGSGEEWGAQAGAGAWGWNAWSALEKLPGGIVISGRDGGEESRWWDAEATAKARRPGPGVLASVVAERIHNPEHTLFRVQVDQLERRGRAATPSAAAPAATEAIAATTAAAAPPLAQTIEMHASAPTLEELRTALPHPDALYCRKHNAWVIVLIHPSHTTQPPLVNPGVVLPAPERRHQASCIASTTHEDVAHHFHRYPRAVDAREVGYVRSPWEAEQRAKVRRRSATINEATAPQPDADADAVASSQTDTNADAGPELLDYYVCCQCSTYVLASETIPGVVPVRLLDDLAREKLDNPTPGRSGEHGVLVGIETIINIIQNRLFKNETRQLPVTRTAFQRKLGWNRTVQQIFESIGFTVEMSDNGLTLMPPSVEGASRARLIRAWIELGAWAADWVIRFPAQTREHLEVNNHKPPISIQSAREEYQRAIGAHPEQIPRSDDLADITDDTVRESVDRLGLTPTTVTASALVWVYFAQARCDPGHTPAHFSALFALYTALSARTPTEDLQTAILDERTRERWTFDDLQRATATLGFGRTGELRVDLDADVDDAFIERAYRDVLRRRGGSEAVAREAGDALRIIAEARGSATLRRAWETKGMAPERAFALLGADERSVEDALLVTVFRVTVDDQPTQRGRLTEALSVIAEYRDSARLRLFLETGEDPGEITTATRRDWPRGLNQLGNTCYLNSLLQYFYTIKDLRAAITPLGARGSSGKDGSRKDDEDDKLTAPTDDELRRHRVGGRLVSRREVVRSKRFVTQLAGLFFQMQCADNPAVTPTIELAKLALVSHRDEEDEEEERAGAGGTGADSDATLVDDGPVVVPTDDGSPPPRVIRTESPTPAIPSPSSSRSGSSSVLGKRSRDPMEVDRETRRDDMDVNVSVVAERPAPPPPPLPPRKPSEGGMMFGRQHDLTECMDNCIFQIETALLKFGGIPDPEDDKTSLVKRLFYGKRKQRIVPEGAGPSGRSATVHEREDPFFQLPINVSDEGYDLYDGLAGYFADAAVELDKRPARMEAAIAELPPILQIQLQRAQFDRETLMSYKSQAYVRFGETLYMDRFLDGITAEKKEASKKIQSELGACRERIHQLTAGKHAPYGPALSNTAEFLQQVEALDLPELDAELVTHLLTEQNVLTAELEEHRTRAGELKRDLEALWADERTAEYELTSVFIHRGSSPSFGHYFFYARYLPEKPDEWFKYNDSEVSVVTKEEVLADTTGQTANPYMLAYVRKGADLIDTVDRIDDGSVDA